MPVTRAFSALSRIGSYKKSASASHDHQNEDVMALKIQVKTAAKGQNGACRALVAGALTQLNVQNSNSSKGSSSDSSSSASNASTPSRPRYVRGTSRLSSRSSTSSRRSILGSSEFGDSSDEEDGRSNSRRLGGCSYPSAANQPDDGNKENVAPFRCTSQDVLDSEARDAQQEDAVRRTTTRARQGSLAERQSFTSPVMHLRRPSRSSATSDMATTSGKFLIPLSPHSVHQDKFRVDDAASSACWKQQSAAEYRRIRC